MVGRARCIPRAGACERMAVSDACHRSPLHQPPPPGHIACGTGDAWASHVPAAMRSRASATPRPDSQGRCRARARCNRPVRWRSVLGHESPRRVGEVGSLATGDSGRPQGQARFARRLRRPLTAPRFPGLGSDAGKDGPSRRVPGQRSRARRFIHRLCALFGDRSHSFSRAMWIGSPDSFWRASAGPFCRVSRG
jgi:hypothetical protein